MDLRVLKNLLILVFSTPFLLPATSASMAADFHDLFETREFKIADVILRYRLMKPLNVERGKRYPLVLFFHGAGERGDDNTKQLIHGMADFAKPAIRRQYPCFVVAPQCPEDQQWVDTPWTLDAHSMPEEPAPALQMSLDLIESLQKEFPVEPARIYVTGLSMGGFGVWDAIQRKPNMFAAAAPICGGGDQMIAKSIAAIPIWAFHGDKDTVVKPRRSRDMIAALKAAGGTPRYTEYPGVGHNSWVATYRDAQLYAWMFKQKR
jgi:predicted peptidase